MMVNPRRIIHDKTNNKQKQRDAGRDIEQQEKASLRRVMPSQLNLGAHSDYDEKKRFSSYFHSLDNTTMIASSSSQSTTGSTWASTPVGSITTNDQNSNPSKSKTTGFLHEDDDADQNERSMMNTSTMVYADDILATTTSCGGGGANLSFPITVISLHSHHTNHDNAACSALSNSLPTIQTLTSHNTADGDEDEDHDDDNHSSLSWALPEEEDDTSIHNTFSKSISYHHDTNNKTFGSPSVATQSKKLKQTFKRRERLLRRISSSLSDTGSGIMTGRTCNHQRYHNYLKRQEGKVKVLETNRVLTLSNDDNMQQQAHKNKPSQKKWFDNWLDLCLFEWYHTFPGTCAMVFYCIAHASLHNLISILHGFLFGVDKSYTASVLGMTFVFGICLLRFSGGVFTSWLSDDLYQGVKFDLYNRSRLRELDVKIMRWIHNKKQLRQCMDLLGFYLCFVVISRILDEYVLPRMCHLRDTTTLLEHMPSQMYSNISDGNTTYIHTYSSDMILQSSSMMGHTTNNINFGFPKNTNSSTCFTNNCSNSTTTTPISTMNSMEYLLETLDMDFLYTKSHLSTYSFYAMFGWGTNVIPLIEKWSYMSFYLIWSIVSVMALSTLEHSHARV